MADLETQLVPIRSVGFQEEIISEKHINIRRWVHREDASIFFYIDLSLLVSGGVSIQFVILSNRFFLPCHPDDRREEGSRKHKVDVTEILRRYAPLNDI